MSCLIYLPEKFDSFESFLCSLEQEEDCLEASSSDGKPLDMSSSTNIASKSWKLESEKDTLTMPPSLETSDSLLRGDMRKPTLDMSMSSVQASRSPASRFQSQESAREQTTAGTCGLKPSGLFGKCDPVMRCVKTCQVLLAGIMDTSDEYLTTFPKAGMMRDGELFRRPTWTLPISGKGSGYWRTPAH